MGMKFAKRAAASILRRGVNAVRVKPEAAIDASKALTKEDIRRLIQKGDIYAIKAKENAREGAKKLKDARSHGRSRGVGSRRGTRKVRVGRKWEKKVRSQRRLLKELKNMKKIDTKTFTTFYRQIKGNQYETKANLLLQLREHGVQITEQDVKMINDKVSAEYKGSK